MNYRYFLPIALLAAGLTGCGQANNPASNAGLAVSVIPDEPIKDVPISATTHFAAGQLCESRGDFTNAMLHYKYAINDDKRYPDPVFRLACVYSEIKRYGDSIETWHRYLKLTHETACGYNNLAYTEELAGNPAAAEADYKLGITKDPTNEPCRVNYGLMLARHGRVGEATIQLQAVLSPAQVHYNLAAVYECQSRPEMAKIEYQQALAVDPNFTDARDKLASIMDSEDPD